MASRVILVVGVGMLAGCSTAPENQPVFTPLPTIPTVPLFTPLPKPRTAPLSSRDRIRIEVKWAREFEPPWLSTQAVDTDGDVKVHGGTVHVEGLSPEEAAKRIRDYYALKEIMWGHGPPQVSLSRF